MAHLYDEDLSDDTEDFADYENYDKIGGIGQQNFQRNPTFGGPQSYGAASTFGGGMGYGTAGMGSMGAGGFSAGIGFGQASSYGGIGGGPSFGMASAGGGAFGGDALATDYVDLSNVKAPEMNKHQPNKYATSAKSSMRKAGTQKASSRGVSFGDVTTFHVDKESNLTETDKKSKSEDNDSDEDDDEEDELQNKALASNMNKDKKEKKDDVQPGAIASMLKKMANLEESITESGSMGLKKSVDSEEYKISSSNDDLPKRKKSPKATTKDRSPSGLSDSEEHPHAKSHDLDSNKKLSSEHDSAALSRDFNYEESEEISKSKFKSDKSKKSADNDTEYEDDFEGSSNLYESSISHKLKRSNDKYDEIEDIRKRNQEYKSNLDAFKKGFKSGEEHEEEISNHLDSYRAKDEIKEESEKTTPKASSKSSPKYSFHDARLSAEEKQLKDMVSKDRDLKSKSLEFRGEDLESKARYEAEIDAKRQEMDAQISRVEALNANESLKRMKEKMEGYIKDINMYRVEIEALKRQVDIADSNAKSKEVEANQIRDEYEHKLKLLHEKHAHSNVRQESREINELKREIRLLKEAHEQEAQEKFEEIDYLTKRCEKLESENVSLRVGNKAVRDAESKAKKYEEEVHSLRMRLREQMKSKEAAPVTGSNYNNWTKDQLVKELVNIDRAIERFTKENETLMHENKKKTAEIQELNSLLYKESQKIEDYKHKLVKETGSVMVVEDDKDLHVKAFNDLGIKHAITQKEYNELKEKLFNAQKSKNDMEQEFTSKEINYKAEIEKIREQRVEAERKLITMDSSLKTQIAANDKLKEDYTNAVTKLECEKAEVQQKLDWYMENQDILDKDVEQLRQKDERIAELKEEIKQIQGKDGGRKRMATLEKQVKDLQEALKKKNPDSIPLMLNAVKPSFEDQEEYRKLKEQNERLKKTIQDKDDEFDKKIRTLRIEIDKMKSRYDKSKATPLPEDLKDKRIYDLERQLQETKDYYQARLKKLQDDKPKPDRKAEIKEEMKLMKEIEKIKKANEATLQAKKKLEKEVRGLKKAQKEKPADLVGAVHALMTQDYVFGLCGLYKDTLKVKKMLEKNSKFDQALKEIEELVDAFTNASETYKSNKALILFSKVTDKCVELSKIVENLSEGKAKQDKSKPHAKLTAIEHLLKEEIESCLGQSLDQPNTDLKVVDIDESVGSKPVGKKAANKLTADAEEGYWSDFSDDDYTCETNEEKKATEILFSLQRWIYSSNLEEELNEKFPNRLVITLDEFKETLNDVGYY